MNRSSFSVAFRLASPSRPLLALILVFTIVLTGCTGLKYSSEHEAGVPYAQLKAYAWFPDDERPPGTHDFARPETAALIRQAIDGELMTRGFRLVGRQDADFLVAFRANAQNQFSRASQSKEGSSSRYDFSVRGGKSALGVKTEGTLTIAFINDKARKAFWKGMASGVLKEQPARPSMVRDAVARILDQYPPAP